jgi:glycosyltransferase 2 family protein
VATHVNPVADSAVAQKRPRRSSLWSRPSRSKLFATAKGVARQRRPADVFVLVLCLLGLLAVVKTSTPPASFWLRLSQLSRSLPGFFDILWRASLWVLSGWAVFLIGATILGTRWGILRDQALSLVGTGVAILVVESAVGGPSRSLWGGTVAVGPPPDPVSVRLAFVVAAVATITPYIARPYRGAGWWIIGAGGISAAAAGATTPSGAVLGLLCGTSAAATVHLVFGSSGGRPSLAEVRTGLADLGVEAHSLSESGSQEPGVFVVEATDADGSPLLVKAYGRDAWDTQFLAKAWRAVWYRETSTLSVTRLQQVEHEGFVTLLAARNGVPTQDVVKAGITVDKDALIVTRLRGTPLGGDQTAMSDQQVGSVWDTALALAAAGVVHGDLHPGAFRFEGGRAVLGSMAKASVATAQDQRCLFLAQLLTLSALSQGVKPAVNLARQRLSSDQLVALVPYIQKAALGPRLREASTHSHLNVDDLRAQAASVAGIEAPNIAKVRRVSTHALVQTGLLVAAAYFLISTLANVNGQELAHALRSASVPLLLLALLIGQLPRFCYAESVRAACPRPIAFGPAALLEFAIGFVNLVLPSAAGRMAVDLRFFQRQGIPPASALSISAIDNAGDYGVQIVIILTALIFGFGDLHVGLKRSSGHVGGLLLLLLIILAVVAVVVVVVAAVPRLRNKVLKRVRPQLSEIHDTFATMRSPTRLARLFLSNLGAELILACTLGVVLVSLGTSLSLATLLVVNVGVSFFAGLIPIPGGVGVTEGAMVVGLTAAGVDQATAFAAAICYRLCTYYLPPIWGWLAFRRLEKTGLL